MNTHSSGQGKAPLVSVIIPTYRHAQLLPMTLESVFAQTLDDYELIVINDGSPDHTTEVLQPYITKNRLRYFEQKNAGQSAARNRGLAEARGKFIAYLDDDDLWPPDKLAWQVAALHADSALGMVGGPCELIDGNGDGIECSVLPLGRIGFAELCLGCPFHSPGQTLIRAELLRDLAGFEEKIWGADDYDLWFRLSEKAGIAIFPRLALRYRRHSGNASKDVDRMYVNLHLVARRHIDEKVQSTLQPAKTYYEWLYTNCARWLVRDWKFLRSEKGIFFRFVKLCERINNLRQIIAHRWLRPLFLRDVVSTIKKWEQGRNGDCQC